MDANNGSVDVGDADGLFDAAERQISRAARHAAAVVASASASSSAAASGVFPSSSSPSNNGRRHGHHRSRGWDGSGGRGCGHRDGAEVGAATGARPRHHRRQQPQPQQQQPQPQQQQPQQQQQQQPQPLPQPQPQQQLPQQQQQQEYALRREERRSSPVDQPQHWHEHGHSQSAWAEGGEYNGPSPSASFAYSGSSDNYHPEHNWGGYSAGGPHPQHHHDWPHPQYSHTRSGNSGGEEWQQRRYITSEHNSGSGSGSFSGEGGAEVVHHHHPQHPHPPHDNFSSSPDSGQRHHHSHPPGLPPQHPQPFHGDSSTPSVVGQYGNGPPGDGLHGQEYYHQHAPEEYNPHHHERKVGGTVTDGQLETPLHMHPLTQRHGYGGRPPPKPNPPPYPPPHRIVLAKSAASASASLSSSSSRDKRRSNSSGNGHPQHRAKKTAPAKSAASSASSSSRDARRSSGSDDGQPQHRAKKTVPAKSAASSASSSSRDERRSSGSDDGQSQHRAKKTAAAAKAPVMTRIPDNVKGNRGGEGAPERRKGGVPAKSAASSASSSSSLRDARRSSGSDDGQPQHRTKKTAAAAKAPAMACIPDNVKGFRGGEGAPKRRKGGVPAKSAASSGSSSSREERRSSGSDDGQSQHRAKKTAAAAKAPAMARILDNVKGNRGGEGAPKRRKGGVPAKSAASSASSSSRDERRSGGSDDGQPQHRAKKTAAAAKAPAMTRIPDNVKGNRGGEGAPERRKGGVPAKFAASSGSSSSRDERRSSGSDDGEPQHRAKKIAAAAKAPAMTRIPDTVKGNRGGEGAPERGKGGASKGGEATDDAKDGRRGRGGSDGPPGGGAAAGGSAPRRLQGGREGRGGQPRTMEGGHLRATEDGGRASSSAPSSSETGHAGFDLAAEVGSLHPQSKYRALVDQLLAKQRSEMQVALSRRLRKEALKAKDAKELGSIAAKCEQYEMAPKKLEKDQKILSSSNGDANVGPDFYRGGKTEHSHHVTTAEDERKRQRIQHEKTSDTALKRVRWLTPEETRLAERVKAKRDQLASQIRGNNALVALIGDCEEYRKHRQQLGTGGDTTDKHPASFSSIRLSTDQDALREELEGMKTWFLHELTPQEQNQHLKMAVPKLIAVNQAACESIRGLHVRDMQCRVDKSSSILSEIRRNNQHKLRRRKRTCETRLLAARRSAEKFVTKSDMVTRLKMETMEGKKEKLRKSWNVEAYRLRAHHEKLFRKDVLTMKTSCEKERKRKRAFLDSVVQHFTLRLKEMEACVGRAGLHSSLSVRSKTCLTVNENEKKNGDEVIPCEQIMAATEAERPPAADEVAQRTISTLKQDVCRLKASLITFARSRRRRLSGVKNDKDEKMLADLEEHYKELLMAFENNADFYGCSHSTEVEPPVQHPRSCVPLDAVSPVGNRRDHYRHQQQDEDEDLSDVGITLSDIEEVEKLVKNLPRSPVKKRGSAAASSAVVGINANMENTSESELMYLSDFSFLSC